MAAKLKPSGFLVAALLAICVWNAAGALRQNFHWPLMVEDDWTRLSRDLIHAKDVLDKLPVRHIEYRTEDASDTYDGVAYYRLQSILAPTILQREPVEDRYVLDRKSVV